jgi:hypothetical protein
VDWGSSSVWLERLPVTQKVASSSLVYPANSFFCLTNIQIYNILYIMKEITKELDKITKQISTNNGYVDDVRIELNKINETLILIAQILRNK